MEFFQLSNRKNGNFGRLLNIFILKNSYDFDTSAARAHQLEIFSFNDLFPKQDTPDRKPPPRECRSLLDLIPHREKIILGNNEPQQHVYVPTY